VRKIFGKYGEFAIGSIQTPIGEFSVKQSELDEYEEGTSCIIARLVQVVKV
jgi:hypothetical protein